MILISHRGNIDGANISEENNPNYIDLAISKGYDVEVDVWVENEILYLGHDAPVYKINIDWFLERISNLWIHCKNVDSIIFFKKLNKNFNFFWHEKDTITLTSQSYLWVYPGKQPIEGSIAVLPELNNDNLSLCLGICSDYIKNYHD